ncbi:hypothetical protein H6F88_03120 [Oculatella sp. FACHB-28]|uniref:DUF6391 domain-containing protein n=1 Tax=Cyanophyceae TaxID=3028117 RepID=UPI0016864FEF|nr:MULTISPECIES: DUF6391 domain-containing protein [Cyanophyceae]MBD1995573.1 hypothetical protein [Leptolyngbya sp. FACHB-541]MBD2055020.1 hypothetical protein [Oculatella sp. FACHB-28]
MAIASSPNASRSPFDFSPEATQDSALLHQLGFIPGLKEILMVRQVHALEHATIWLLSGNLPDDTVAPPTLIAGSNSSLGGMSTDQGFYVYGTVTSMQLRRAAHSALLRLVNGEWDLAVHPRCGTNLSVGMVMAAGLVLGVPLVLPRNPLEQFLGMGLAATAATQLAPEIGNLAQRYVTTAIPFNLAIETVNSLGDRQGRPVHFVQVRWVEQPLNSN